MTDLIDVKNLRFGYEHKLILDNISFSVEKGDFLGVIGPNGSGKSTLLKLMLGMLTPLDGNIRILGQEIDKFSQWNKVGYVSQKASSFNSMFPATVEEVVKANIISKVGLLRTYTKQQREQVDYALELVEMKEYKNKLIGSLSGGQQQRVFIARVLVSHPELMFLDEPTVGIDARSEEAVYCLLAKLNQELGISIVMVTHDISAVLTHANKLACLADNGLVIHHPQDNSLDEYLANIVGYNPRIRTHRHCCENCCRRVECDA
jgi:zinc transport system ATP-binding protein